MASSTDALELLGVLEPVAIAYFSDTSLSHPLPLLHGLSHSLSVLGHLDAGGGWNPASLQPNGVFSPPACFLLPLPTLPCSCAHSVAKGTPQRTAYVAHFKRFTLLKLILETKINLSNKNTHCPLCVLGEDRTWWWCQVYLCLWEELLRTSLPSLSLSVLCS